MNEGLRKQIIVTTYVIASLRTTTCQLSSVTNTSEQYWPPEHYKNPAGVFTEKKT